MTYAEKLKDPRWQKMRLDIMQRDGFCCRLCSDTSTTLHIHHTYYKQYTEPWEYPSDSLVTYCEHCHKLVEFVKKERSELLPLVVGKSGRENGILMLGIFQNVMEASIELLIIRYNQDWIIEHSIALSEKTIQEVQSLLVMAEKLRYGNIS